MSVDSDWQERLRTAAQAVRTNGALGKSAQIGRLFDFLVEQSLAGRTPKEIEVAQEVFDLSTSEQIGHDATVRMMIHRLRKKLEDLPANDRGERLVLPRGEYRLHLMAPAQASAEATDPSGGDAQTPAPAPELRSFPGSGGRPRWPWLLAGIALGLLVGGLAVGRWPLPQGDAGHDPQLGSIVWQSMARAHFPMLIVNGDRYTFGEADSQGRIFRYLRDPAVTSSEKLDRYNALNRGREPHYVDLNLFELPASMGPALAAVLPVVNEVTGGQNAGATITSSFFTTDMLKAHNILYVGLLSDLRDLREPIFDNSGFELAASGDVMIDRQSRRRFQSDWADPSQERMLRRDYAYIASFPGPRGNRILIIAGMNDPALAEGAQIVARQSDLDTLTAKVGQAQAFEALYEIRTFGPSSVASHLVVARRTQVDRQWRDLPRN